MTRDLGDGYELDDDPARIDVAAVHAFISGESYWAPGRPFDVQERLIREARRYRPVRTPCDRVVPPAGVRLPGGGMREAVGMS